MNDQTTTDGEETPDERVVAAIRDVAPTTPSVRRAHLDAAMAAYDDLEPSGAHETVAPVIPLRSRSTRVLQVAAAIVLLVAGLTVAATLVNGASDQQADSSGSELATTAEGGGTSDGRAESNAADAAGDADASGEQMQGALGRAGAADAAKGSSPSTTASAEAPAAAPRVPAGPEPGRIGGFATREVLRDALQAQVDAGTLPIGFDPGVACPAPPAGASFVTATSANVAGDDVVVWVALGGGSGRDVAIVLVDPTTCAVID